MYNPTEGKLRKNKYLNIGYEASPTWETRKLIADCIEIYLDEFSIAEHRTTENALVMLPLFKCRYLEDCDADTVFKRKLNENSSRNSARKIRQMLAIDNEEKNKAAAILCLINSGPLRLD